MKQITIAKSAGFCFGVDRAVRMTYEALEQYPHVATLGPIIHNQTVVDDLCQKGARIVEDVSELTPEECIVIRSHGVSQASGRCYCRCRQSPASMQLVPLYRKFIRL